MNITYQIEGISENNMQTEIIKVNGMKGQPCVEMITQTLRGMEGVIEVSVTLASGRTTVRYEEHVASSIQLRAALIKLGFDVDPAAGKSHSGCCGSCGG